MYLLACAPNEDSNQPAHLRSLISLVLSAWENFESLAVQNAPVKILIMKTRVSEFMYIENVSIKNWKCSDKTSDIIQYVCSKHRLLRGGGTNEYQQTMFLSRNKKNNLYPWVV